MCATAPKSLPMDESLVLCALDLCGRPYLVWDLVLDREKVGDLETEMVREFFYAVSYGAEMNLHLKQLSGTNNHHIIEAAFKAFAKALDAQLQRKPVLQACFPPRGVFRMESGCGPVPPALEGTQAIMWSKKMGGLAYLVAGILL